MNSFAADHTDGYANDHTDGDANSYSNNYPDGYSSDHTDGFANDHPTKKQSSPAKEAQQVCESAKNEAGGKRKRANWRS